MKKKKERVTFYIDSTTHKDFKEYCNKKGYVMSKRVEFLLRDAIKEEEK